MSDEQPVTVEICGITDPATFARLPDALAALWAAMRALPLGELQHDWFCYYLTRPDAALRVTQSLERNGDLALSFTLPDGRPHLLRVRAAAGPPGRVGRPSCGGAVSF